MPADRIRTAATTLGRKGGRTLYGWIWRMLPGRVPVKLACALVLAVAVVALLFLVVFPLVDSHLPNTQVNVNR